MSEIPQNELSTRNSGFTIIHDDDSLRKTISTKSSFARDTSFQRWFQMRERLLNKRIINTYSYGIFMPEYLTELKKYCEKKEDSIHDALLVGCLTIDTAQEFIATVESVCNHSRTEIIDILDRGLIGEVPNFQLMNGIETSFDDNSFDTIHTNFLLHQLTDGKSSSTTESVVKRKNIKNFFQETNRLLKSHGKLIMVEGKLEDIFEGLNPFLVPNQIHKMLSETGFKEIQIKLAESFSEPRDLVRTMQASRGSQINLSMAKTTSQFGNYLITAIKA